MVDDVQERSETTIVIKTTLGVSPQALERSGAIRLRRAAIRLEIIDAELLRGMHVPSGLCVGRGNMAARALLRRKQFLAAPGRGLVKGADGRLGCLEGELIELQRRQLR